VTKKKTTKQMV